MPTAPRTPRQQSQGDDPLLLLINGIQEQIKRISDAQEDLRKFLLLQIEEVRMIATRDSARRDEVESLRREMARRDEVDALKRDIARKDDVDALRRDINAVQGRMDRIEVRVTEKIEEVATNQHQQQEANYKALIRTQAVIIGFIVTTLVGIIIKLVFHF